MIERKDINEVKRQIGDHVGESVMIKANKGRKKVFVREGVIQSTYPSVFVVQLQNRQEQTTRNVSYSYTDILTHDVELRFST